MLMNSLSAMKCSFILTKRHDRVQRFFIPPQSISGGKVVISGNQAHQIARVLRLSKGDYVLVLDNTGFEYKVQLNQVTPKLVKGIVIEKLFNTNEPNLSIALFASLLKKDNFEWMLQKCTEIGVRNFIPIICQRTILQSSEWDNKTTRWERIIQEAAEQSGRGMLPGISLPVKLQESKNLISDDMIAVIAWEKLSGKNLDKAIMIKLDNPTQNHVGIFIGPEGGFCQDEIDWAIGLGITPFSLGKRILRSETAAIVASTIAIKAHEILEQ